MEMGQMILNKDSNEVKRFIEAMEGISKMLDANSLIYRPILNVLIQSPNLQHFNIFGKIPEPLNQPYAKFTNFR